MWRYVYGRLTFWQWRNTDIISTWYFPYSELIRDGSNLQFFVHILAVFNEVVIYFPFYAALNFLSIALQANNEPSKWTLFDGSRTPFLRHEADGDLEVLDTFQAVSSWSQESSLSWTSVSVMVSIDLAMWSLFLALSEGWSIFLFLRYTRSVAISRI